MVKDEEEMQPNKEENDEKELKDEEESQLDSKKEPQLDNKEEVSESNDKEKFEFAIPVASLIVVGILLIVFAFAFFAWDDIKITAGVIFGSEIAEYKKECKNQCELQDQEAYCCAPKGIYIKEKNKVYTCQDETLKTNCELDCRNVCFNLCKDITKMIPCAEAGCTWIVEDYARGYCRVKDGT